MDTLNLLSSSSTTMVDPIQLLILFIISTLLGFAIALTYKKTHRGFTYSQSFSVTTVLITVITTLIIVLISDSVARAIGIFGAFSIIRFRTAVKDVRDVAFIFFALSAGLAVGVGSITTAFIGVIFICALIFLLHSSNFGGLRKLQYVLNFKLKAKDPSSVPFKDVMSKYVKTYSLLNVDAKESGKTLVFTFNVGMKSGGELNDFIAELNSLKGLSDVSVVSSKNYLEF